MKLHFFFLAAGFLRMRTEAGVTSTSCRGGQALRLRFRLEGSLRTAHARLDIVLRSSSRVRRLANNYSALPRPALLATSAPHPHLVIRNVLQARKGRDSQSQKLLILPKALATVAHA